MMFEDQSTQKMPVALHKRQRTNGMLSGRNARHNSRFFLPRWLVVAISAIVIAGGAGVFALVQHPASPVQSTGNGTAHTIFNSSTAQSSRTSSSHASSKSSATNTPPGTAHAPSNPKLFTCTGSSSHNGSFTFTGGVAGAIQLSSFQACYSAPFACYSACYKPGSGGHTYFGRAQGKINGIIYQFEFFINPYSGPGLYTAASNTNVMLMQSNHEWQSYGSMSNHISISVSANGKSGTLHATISMISPEYDPTSIVTVAGAWSN